jgi:hypothetical protein
MGLPWNSQHIPQDFPNNTSNLSHMLCPEFNSHVYKLKLWAIGEHMVKKHVWIGGCLEFQKLSWWVIQYGSFKKQNCEHTHGLVNMNQTIYIIDNNVQLIFQYIQN